MGKDIEFKQIQNNRIFDNSFDKFENNNIISFSPKGIIVIFAPNGTGKTSFIEALSGLKDTKLKFKYNNKEYDTGENIFSTIQDQNDRNIIQGNTKDFYLGENIRKEFELEEKLENIRKNVVDNIIEIATTHKMKNLSSLLLDCFTKDEKDFLSKAINNKNKLNNATNKDIISFVNKIQEITELKYDTNKFNFLENDLSQKTSTIKLLENLKNGELKQNKDIIKFEENNDAIKILNKYPNHNCIICDSEINRKLLLKTKHDKQISIKKTLDDNTKKILEEVLNIDLQKDPFSIKSTILKSIETGDKTVLNPLIDDIEKYKNFFKEQILYDIKNVEGFKTFEKIEAEYSDLIAKQPDIKNEDIEFIQQYIKDCMNKEFKISRAEGKKYLQIQLDEQDFLGKDRKDLPLSTGEQNFLSLFMEFLRVKNSENPIVVIDDPISSFDSIYKNKIIYSIVKVLQDKQIILLTHNTDVIRLLKSQAGKTFNLYILNNTKGSDNNGFISINNEELKLLTDLAELTKFFREDIFEQIKNVNLFLYSMVPFLRGYAHITGNKDAYEQLTKLMHGYMTEKVDIADIYRKLFGDNSIIPETLSIDSGEILSLTFDDEIIDSKHYPLLNKTLRHTLTYLYLRLLVEKTLVEKFQIDINKHKTLGSIISVAFPNDKNPIILKNRIRLTSKKTLINEFNHFEGNLSIFQPAIDITDETLEKEKKDIEDFVKELKKEVSSGKDEIGN